MGKHGKGRSKGYAAGRTKRKALAGAQGEVSPESLPAVSALEHVPAWGDLRFDDEQRADYESFVAKVRACGEDARADAMQPGFVVRLDRGFPLVVTENLVLRAEHSVAFAKKGRGEDPALLPAVGDALAVRCDTGHDMGVIERVLPRRSALGRWRGENRGARQVLAANVDSVFVVLPVGGGRDELRVICDWAARSLVLAHDCGAESVVVLTKADRCDAEEIERVVAGLHDALGENLQVVVTSSVEGVGLDEVRSCIPAGSCGLILGESGAGKSTLLNMLLGRDALETSHVRERDDAGRHTTVARMMVKLAEPCGVMIDAPGLRSLPLMGNDRGLELTFPDVMEAAASCRFSDCTHTHEPGCGVRAAQDEGRISAARVEVFVALADAMRESARSLAPDVRV